MSKHRDIMSPYSCHAETGKHEDEVISGAIGINDPRR